jgi:hypothetical protein
MSFLIGLVLKLGVPQRFAKLALVAGLVVLLVVGLGVAKCAYDKSIIDAHDAQQNAVNAKADRRADENAAVERRVDDTRLSNEAQELGKAGQNVSNDRDRRIARQRCIRLQQSARASGGEPPACS